jgi:hypothetical protein
MSDFIAISNKISAVLDNMSIIIANQEKIIMTQSVNTDALVAIAAKLKADDAAALALLQSIRDENVSLAAQLAALPPATDPAAQAIIDAAVASLTDTAAAVETAVAANPATPNLPPPPPKWTAGAAVTVGGKVTLSTGVVLTATAVTGPTGATEPVSPGTGSTVVDGGVTWTL